MAYTKEKRAAAGFKRFIKVMIPAIPILLDLLPQIDIPYKETIVIILGTIIALEKAYQKDKSKV